jgi:MFS family permease
MNCCLGIGFGLIYLPAIVVVGYYFERKRALATGIAVAGSGVGTFVFPPVAVYLIQGGCRFSTRNLLSAFTNVNEVGLYFLMMHYTPHSQSKGSCGHGNLFCRMGTAISLDGAILILSDTAKRLC